RRRCPPRTGLEVIGHDHPADVDTGNGFANLVRGPKPFSQRRLLAGDVKAVEFLVHFDPDQAVGVSRRGNWDVRLTRVVYGEYGEVGGAFQQPAYFLDSVRFRLHARWEIWRQPRYGRGPASRSSHRR